MAYPADFAAAIVRTIQLSGGRAPREEELALLCEAMFFASLATEELRGVRLAVAVMNPRNPDPDPPLLIRSQKWNVSRLAAPITVTPRSLAKVARAVSGISSYAAVHFTAGRWSIWGLVDQAIHEYRWVRNEVGEGGIHFGPLTLSIDGPGSISARFESCVVATLRGSTVSRGPVDAMSGGPIWEQLHDNATRLCARTRLGAVRVSKPLLATRIAQEAVTALARILVSIRQAGTGGALIVGVSSSRLYRAKYGINYGRLGDALCRVAIRSIALDDADSAFMSNLEEHRDLKIVSADRAYKMLARRGEFDDAASELTGTVATIASMAEVDGAVVLDPIFRVRGFGAELTSHGDPPRVRRAVTPAATKSALREVDWRSFGTRHKSAMRACWNSPSAVAFVISQDGGVRAIKRVGNEVVLWDEASVLQNGNLRAGIRESAQGKRFRARRRRSTRFQTPYGAENE